MKHNNITILIVDDHPLIRRGLTGLFENEEPISNIFTAGNGIEAINILKTNDIDVVLLDINMPGKNGIEVLRDIKKNNPNQKVIILTLHDTGEYINSAFNNGCDGFVNKDADIDVLLKCVETVLDNKNFLQPNLVSNIIDIPQQTKKITYQVHSTSPILSNRELDTLSLLSNKLSNKEIAEELNIAEKTVRNHLTNIFKKIKVKSRKEAILWFLENKLKQ